MFPAWVYMPDMPSMEVLETEYAIPPREVRPVFSNDPIEFDQRPSRDIIKSHWIELHEHVWTSRKNAKQFFADWWSRKPATCNCKGADQILADNPVSFRSRFSFFESGVRLHNAVSSKPELASTHPRFSIEQALRKWRPELWPSQPRMNITAVTSISPLSGHQETQKQAILSWGKMGLDIISVNLEHEIPKLQPKFPDIRFYVGRASEHYDRPTPTIRSMLDYCVSGEYLLINSDCALYGPQSLLANSPSVILRHNWTNKPADAVREQWGLDAFRLNSDIARSIPDLPFAIGKPMWDYWMAWHLERSFDLDWIGEPLIYHKAHDIHWQTDECDVGRKWVTGHYSESPNWVEWRYGRPHVYSKYSDWRKKKKK
jgi:hypothetical protein